MHREASLAEVQQCLILPALPDTAKLHDGLPAAPGSAHLNLHSLAAAQHSSSWQQVKILQTAAEHLPSSQLALPQPSASFLALLTFHT